MHAPTPAHDRSQRARRHGARTLGVAICVAALPACSLGPFYHRPALEAPTQWLGADGQGASWPESEWWRGFASDDLNGFISQAQRTNDDLHAAVARVHQADAQRHIAAA